MLACWLAGLLALLLDERRLLAAFFSLAASRAHLTPRAGVVTVTERPFKLVDL